MATALLNVASKYENGPIAVGDRWKNLVTFDFDHYATNGCSLTASDLGFASTTDPEFDVIIPSKNGYVFHYDHTNSKVLAYYQTDPAATGGANVALIEVSNNADLSSVTGVRAHAEGRFRA